MTESAEAPNVEWWTKEQAAAFLSVSIDTIDRNRVLWTSKPPKRGKYRYKLCMISNRSRPRIWADDVKACLFVPGE